MPWGKRMIARLILILLSVTLAFPAGMGRAEAGIPITIGIAPVVPAASTYIALDKGWFAEAGFDVTIEEIATATSLIPFLATGKIQVVHGGLGAIYFNAMAQGLPITLALDSGSSPINQDFVIRPDLQDTLKKVDDLKGRSVGFVAPAGVPVYSVGKLLETVGLTIKDIESKFMTFPDMATALSNKAIDAALAVPPWGDIIVDRKLGVRWLDPSTMIAPKPLELVAYSVNTDWATANPDLAKKLFLVLARGGREYCQAYHHGPNRAEISETLVKHKIINDRTMVERMPWQARDPNGHVNQVSLIDQQEWFYRYGMLKKRAPENKLADARYAENAAKELGPFVVENKDSKLEGCR